MKAQAKMKLAQLRLDRTEISLPYDVRVTASDIDVGQFVGPADLVGRASTLGSVYRTDALQVRAPIEEDSSPISRRPSVVPPQFEPRQEATTLWWSARLRSSVPSLVSRGSS